MLTCTKHSKASLAQIFFFFIAVISSLLMALATRKGQVKGPERLLWDAHVALFLIAMIT